MAPISLPPGFGFHPTDEELVAYYLKRKVQGHKIELDIIPEVDLYKCEPWDLPDKICIPSKDLQWHFFCPRDRKYPNGSRTNRATEAGYWKATGRDRKVNSQRGKIGTKKTLVFHRGRAPFGERTDWVMHEYRLDEECQGAAGLQDSFVLCRVVKKNGLETKSDDQSIAQTENNDSSCAKNNTFPDNLALTSYTENQSKESSSPILQEDEINKSLRFSKPETPSATFNDMTEDSNAIERWLDVLLDDPDQNVSLTSPVESENNTKVDVAQGVQQIISYPPQAFDWIPADVNFTMPGDMGYCQLSKTLETSFEEAEIIDEILLTAEASQADNTEVDYLFNSDIANIDEIWREDLGDDILPSLEELEYTDTSLVQRGNNNNPEVTGIQLRQRRQTYQQEVPFQGTAMKRVRLQKYPVQESAVEHQQDGYIAYPNNDYTCDLQEQFILFDSFNGQNHNSKITTQLQDPVPLAPARKINTIREGHVPDHLRGPLTNEILGTNRQKAHSVRGLNSSFSGDNSKPGTSSMGVWNSPANEIQHILHGSEFDFSPNSADIPDRVTVNHVISSMPPQTLTYGLFLNNHSSEIVDIPAESPTQTMKHEPGNSMDVWKSQKRELTPPTKDKIHISKIKSEVGQHSTVAVVQNCEIAPSEYDLETPNQFGKPSKGSSPEEVPDSLGSSSRVLHPEKMRSALSSAEPISVGGGRKTPGRILKAKFWRSPDSLGSSSRVLHPEKMRSALSSSEPIPVGGGQKTSGRILKLCRSIPSHAASMMEYLGRFNPMKAILPSEFACRKTHAEAVSVGNMRTCKCTEGNMEHARSDIFSRLTHRVKSRVKSVMPDSGEKTEDATQRFCNCCADQGNSGGFHGLEQPSGVLNGFSEFLSRRAPTSSTGVIVSVCVLSTTILLFLFLLFRGIWRFARTVSAHFLGRDRVSCHL